MKAQAEIIGIAIVALLVVSLVTTLNYNPSQPEKIETEEIPALTSLLKVKVTCEQATVQISSLVLACIEEDCSCRDSALQGLLEGLYGERVYDFEIMKNDIVVFQVQTAECAQKSVQLPSHDKVEVRLGIC